MSQGLHWHRLTFSQCEGYSDLTGTYAFYPTAPVCWKTESLSSKTTISLLTQASWFHPRGCVDGISKQAIPRHLDPYNSSGTGTWNGQKAGVKLRWVSLFHKTSFYGAVSEGVKSELWFFALSEYIQWGKHHYSMYAFRKYFALAQKSILAQTKKASEIQTAKMGSPS